MDGLKIGDLILMKGNGVFSRIVRYATKSEYTHVSVYVGYGYSLDVDGFRKASLRPLTANGGFTVHRLKRDLKHFEEARLLIEAMSLIEETEGYDWFEAIKIMLKRLGVQMKRVGRPRRHLCTELCLELYRRLGMDIQIEGLEPERLARHESFRQVFPESVREIV